MDLILSFAPNWAAIGVPSLIWTISATLLLWGTWLTLRHLKPRNCPVHPAHLPGALPAVSILKPLKGADEGLRENLRSFFTQDYPEFELLFTVADPADPAAAIVRELQNQYPAVRARLDLGSLEIGPNPKVNNLVFSYGKARHDWILISDSNTRVPRDYLRRLLAQAGPQTGIITALVRGSKPQGLGGHLEALYLNTFYARAMLQAAGVGRPCVIGKSMLFRRSMADRFGGIGALARYLAEDFMAGEAMRRLGLHVTLMQDPVPQHIGRYTLKEFWSRHVRWGRIRKAQCWPAFAAEILAHPLVSASLGASAWNQLDGPGGFLGFASVSLSVVQTLDGLLEWKMRGQNPTLRSFVIGLVTWPALQVTTLCLWFKIASGNTVDWRGQRLKLLPGGMLAK